MKSELYKYEVTDDQFSMTINAVSAIDALHQFIIFNYGGVIYNKDVKLEVVE